MASEPLALTARELTSATLPDFERLFKRRPAGGAFLCWCLYHHGIRYWPTERGSEARARAAARNRQTRRDLVKSGRSHGVLVYSKGEPVGWCQYGSWDELPRFERHLGHARPVPASAEGKRWRITCFVVDAKYRGRGVATTALRAALVSIGKRGGGLVEAYPITRRGAYRDYLGTVSMFRREGFEIVAPFGKNNVVVRRVI